MYTIAIILKLIGELLIAIAILRVHAHVLKEHRLDKDVYKTIRGEKVFVIIGILFLITGTILQISLI
jgi:hypothetical protein